MNEFDERTVELDERTLEELFHRGRWLSFPDFVRLIEQDHPHDGPGVSKEVLDAYAEALVDDLGGSAPFTVEAVDRMIETHLTDSGVWLESALYDVGPDRISAYPAPWHDRLGRESDPRAYVEVMRDELAKARGFTARGRAAPGVPKQQLLDAMCVLGEMDRAEATRAIDEERRRNELLLYPYQNPEAEVQLPDSVEPPRTERLAEEADGEDAAAHPPLPPLVDVRDDLEYLRENVGGERQDRVDEIERMLVALTERDVAHQEERLDEIDAALSDVELESRGRVEQRAAAARTRIRTYRRTLEGASEGLTVLDRKIRHAHTGQVFSVAPLRGSDAEVDATVLNDGRSRDVIAIVTFYDVEGRTVSKARSRRTRIEPDSERVVSSPVHVPTGARYYTVTPLDVEDYAANYQFQ